MADPAKLAAYNDKEAADLFIGLYKDRIVMSKGIAFVKKGNEWIYNTKIANLALLRMCIESNIYKCDRGKSELKPYSTNVCTARNIIRTAKARLPDDSEFIKRLIREGGQHNKDSKCITLA